MQKKFEDNPPRTSARVPPLNGYSMSIMRQNPRKKGPYSTAASIFKKNGYVEKKNA